LIDNNWNDIDNRFADDQLELTKFKRINKDDLKKGALSAMGFENIDFVQSIIYLCEQLKATAKLEAGNKLKIVKENKEEGDLVELKVKFYESENGEKHAEFIKEKGEIMSFYELVGDINDAFNKLSPRV